MSKKDEALKLALEVLEAGHSTVYGTSQAARAITAIREALAEQPAQPSKPWVGLTAMQIEAIGKPYEEKDRSIRAWGLFACAIEDKLREKNNG